MNSEIHFECAGMITHLYKNTAMETSVIRMILIGLFLTLAQPTMAQNKDVTNKLPPAFSEVFFPLNDEQSFTPYTKVPVRIIAKYKGLDGHYRIEILADGKSYKTFDEPIA